MAATAAADVPPPTTNQPSLLSATAAHLDAIQKLIEETGIEFKVPSSYNVDRDKRDGEIQLMNSDGDLITLQTGTTMEAVFDETLAVLKKLAGASFKTDGDATIEVHDDIKGKGQSGTLDSRGRHNIWLLLVLEGKKPLRILAIGPKLSESRGFRELMESIKKR